MQYLLTSDQSRAADNAAIKSGIAGYRLMQTAGERVTGFICRHYTPCPTIVLCGTGNNGGDGWVIARLLKQKNWPVQTCLLGEAADVRGDAALALNDWRTADGNIQTFAPAALSGKELVIDAMFGTGLTRNIEGRAHDAIEAVNAAALPIVAVDMPSGIHADSGEVMGIAIRATHTITFSCAKPGQFLLPGKAYIGKLTVVDIGIPVPILENIHATLRLNHPSLWQRDLPTPLPQNHKYQHGHAIVAGGGLKCTGAAKLAATATLRSGAGLVSVACDATSLPAYAASLMSVMTKRCDNVDDFKTLIGDIRVSAILIGPGHGVDQRTRNFVQAALATHKPCVLDADALNSFADEPEILLESLHPQCVLTPHEGEFAKLFNCTGDKIERTRAAAAISGCTVLLKGNDTVIANSNHQCVINHNAPASLATAGSGDVLAGIITGLLAQGVPAFSAACAGAWLHGEAATHLPAYGLIAEDLLCSIPKALLVAHDNANPISA